MRGKTRASPFARDVERSRDKDRALSRDAHDVELSLSIAKEGLGLSLGAPVRLGPVEVLELALLLPGLSFPLDVSGGVARFRHRRGALERLVLSISFDDGCAYASSRLAGILGKKPPFVTAANARGVLTLTLTDPEDASVLAFDLATRSQGRALFVIVSRARGALLKAPPTSLALSALARLLPPARVEGAIATLDDVPLEVGRAILPDAGARVPDASSLGGVHVTWNSLGVIVRLSSEANAADAHVAENANARAATDAEIATLTKDADTALLKHDFPRARALLLSLLHRAPRSPEVCQRIAEIDAFERDRAEAALATLADADPSRAILSGTLKGELLARASLVDDAIAALEAGAEQETSARVASSMLAFAASLAKDSRDALAFLDRAVARAPDFAALRKKRLPVSLRAGKMETARADVAHLEAQGDSPREKHDVLVACARAFQDAGAFKESRALLERALRFAPDSSEALARLGIALATEGRHARAATLLADAVDRAPFPEAVLALAGALAALGERPAAIARLFAIGADSSSYIAARALEAKLRAELGELTGASTAYARIRDYVEARAMPITSGAADALLSAEAFERDVRHDALAAKRHADVRRNIVKMAESAITTHDATSREVAGRAVSHEDASRAETTQVTRPATLVTAGSPAIPATVREEDKGARAEALTDALRGAPGNADVVNELAPLLADLGRAHDLVALAFARLDEGDLARTGDALRAALARAEKSARNEGRDSDANLLRDARSALG